MSLFRLLVLFLFAQIAINVSVFAQKEPNFCGTTGKSKWLEEYQKNREAYAEQNDTSWLFAPITFHIVGNDAGAGYFQQHRVFKALCHMNTQFEQAHIKYYLHPTQPFIYHNNSAWYEHDYDSADEMINQNYQSDRVNCFIVADPAGNCGYSWQDVVVMGKNCSGETNSTWGHEFGHHLSLPHPFFGWEGESVIPGQAAPSTIGWNNLVERVERTNCLTAGDGFCDTEPDYISNRWSCNADGRSGEMLDPLGVPFRADGTYLMGYANDQCQYRFMPDQIAAMRANLRTEHQSYLTGAQPSAGISEKVALTAPIDTAITPFNDVQFSWQPVAGAQYYIVEVGLFASFNPIIHYTTTTSTSYQITSGLPKNRLLYWRVKPLNGWNFCEDNSGVQTGVFRSADVTALNELEAALTVSLNPNPVMAGGQLRLQVETETNEQIQMHVYDLNGRSVWSQMQRIQQGEQSIDIPIAALSAGQYRLTMRNEKGILSRTFAVFE